MTTSDLKVSGGTLTVYGKQLVAESMYQKGRSFLGAALLLHQQKGYEFVVLHLLCQGVETTLKGLLLYKDYNKYKNKLKKRKRDKFTFGHALKALADAASSEFGITSMTPTLVAELNNLNVLYSSHRLRYGTFFDILVNPDTIQSRNVWRKIAAVIRLADRHVHPKDKVV